MEVFGDYITLSVALLLLLAMGLALAFEFVNGFHDTANAVATVIYTNSLRPVVAVVWSGFWNLAGVLYSNGAVAFAITALLPVELILHVGSAAGLAMVLSLLVSAIIWNLGTWYRGLPASSSHTLIGSIMGVGLANSLMSKGHVFGEGVNWAKASEVGVSLITSPIVGFGCAAVLLLLSKTTIKRPDLFRAPARGVAPPMWIRGLLILTCTGVSFAHGSNDGQKGMGLIMLILVGVLPGVYALNLGTPQPDIAQIVISAQRANQTLEADPIGLPEGKDPLSSADSESELSDYLKTTGVASAKTFRALTVVNSTIAERLEGKSSLAGLPHDARQELRSDIYLAAETITKLNRQGLLARFEDRGSLLRYATELNGITRFIPVWVKVCVAFTLGLGTMIGWKRIVVTVGEKIGKEHLSYAQGASAELVAMTTIGIADTFGLPVSTTHVLSSGVAGTMAANRSGLQMETLRDIALAWLLTLPMSMFIGGALFAFALNIIVRLGMR